MRFPKNVARLFKMFAFPQENVHFQSNLAFAHVCIWMFPVQWLLNSAFVNWDELKLCILALDVILLIECMIIAPLSGQEMQMQVASEDAKTCFI